MLPDRVSNPGPLTYESGALPIALRNPAADKIGRQSESDSVKFQMPINAHFFNFFSITTH